METIEAFIAPNLVQWARERYHLTIIEAAEKLSVKPDKLAAWETKGDERPTFKQAQRIAQTLHIPFGYLFLQEPPAESLPLPDLRTMAGMPPRDPSPDFLDVLYDALRKQQWYHGYLQEENLPPVLFINRFNINDSPKVIAANISNTLGIDNEVRQKCENWEQFLTQFIHKAEEARVLVLRTSIVGNNTHRKLDPQEFQGFAISDELSPLIFINESNYKTAQIFTLAHELAHLWIGQSGISNPDYMLRSSQQQNKIEQLCDSIAAEVLVPSDDFIIRWDNFKNLDDNLNKLAHNYRVSSFVILRRAYEFNKIKHDVFQSKYKDLLKKIKGIKTGSRGDFYRTLLSRNSSTFTNTIIAATANERISPTEAARLLNLHVSKLRIVENYLSRGETVNA